LQIDPTYDLGEFYVTTTQYEHLLLLSRRTGVHPAMLCPILIHQKKEKETYQSLSQYLCTTRPVLKDLKAFGTDGELGLSLAFADSCHSAIHLRCFIHFQNNLKEHMKMVGIDEANARLVCADLIGQQIGKNFEFWNIKFPLLIVFLYQIELGGKQ